jgi:hypothetical protein
MRVTTPSPSTLNEKHKMKIIKNTFIALLIAYTYAGLATAALSPTINSNHPLEVDMAEALSNVRAELNCNDDHATGITRCEKPTYIYTCSVAKKPSLLMRYHSNTATLEEFAKDAPQKGLSNCVAGNSW